MEVLVGGIAWISATVDSPGFLSAATPSLRRGGMNQLKARVGRRFVPRSATEGPVASTRCVYKRF